MIEQDTPKQCEFEDESMFFGMCAEILSEGELVAGKKYEVRVRIVGADRLKNEDRIGRFVQFMVRARGSLALTDGEWIAHKIVPLDKESPELIFDVIASSAGWGAVEIDPVFENEWQGMVSLRAYVLAESLDQLSL